MPTRHLCNDRSSVSVNRQRLRPRRFKPGPSSALDQAQNGLTTVCRTLPSRLLITPLHRDRLAGLSRVNERLRSSAYALSDTIVRYNINRRSANSFRKIGRGATCGLVYSRRTAQIAYLGGATDQHTMLSPTLDVREAEPRIKRVEAVTAYPAASYELPGKLAWRRRTRRTQSP